MSMTAADRALGLLAHMRVDEQSDAILEALITAWMSGLERPAQVAYGTDTAATWEVLSDPMLAPLWALPHAAMYTGGTIPPRQPGETNDAYLQRARDEVVRPRGMLRGAYSALKTAIQAHLSGSKFVQIVEWVDGNAFRLVARVLADECADPQAAYQAANDDDVIWAGMKCQIVLSTGPVWDEMDQAWNTVPGTWNDPLSAP
jgi:hypothetical protein